MKRNLILIFLLAMILSSCQDKRFQTYMAHVPKYMTYNDLRSSFAVEPAEEMVKPGKIYFKDQYMYVNEYQKGIHVVDLADPSNPALKAFINIPGNVDMAIKDDILYADSFIDLVLIDISDPLQPNEVKRVEEIFEYVIPPYDYEYPLDEIDQEKGVILGYDLKEITREVYYNPYPWPVFMEYSSLSDMSGTPRGGVIGGSPGKTYGVGGSMARFITYDDYLYALESTYKLKSINISNPDNPVVRNEQYLWGNIETIFISGEYMYVGSSNGMHILDLKEPSVPILLSTYQHLTACDPVVVDGDIAYVTLRSGNLCGGLQNLLEVIDISDKENPDRMASYGMTNPHGLGIDNNTLFICEGSYGLKVFDATDPFEISSNKIAEFTDIHAYDVIPLASFLFVIGENGFNIYDYSDLQDITLLGSLPVADIDD